MISSGAFSHPSHSAEVAFAHSYIAPSSITALPAAGHRSQVPFHVLAVLYPDINSHRRWHFLHACVYLTQVPMSRKNAVCPFPFNPFKIGLNWIQSCPFILQPSSRREQQSTLKNIVEIISQGQEDVLRCVLDSVGLKFSPGTESCQEINRLCRCRKRTGSSNTGEQKGPASQRARCLIC